MIFTVILKILLIPVSLLYGLIIEIRNLMYRLRIFKTHKFPVPVISVGNITAGGTGKTPFTIFLANALKEKYRTLAVISRGYGRRSRGMQLVSDGSTIKNDALQSGDEPLLIAKKVPGAIVAVAERRKEAIEFVIKNFEVKLIILDDAFQHRAVHRDIDFLLINVREPFKWNLPLPSGTLREFQHNRKRADFIINTNIKTDTARQFRGSAENIFNSFSEVGDLYDADFKFRGTTDQLKDRRICAFSGIADGERFIDALRDRELEVVYHKNFRDHYVYSEAAIDQLLQAGLEYRCEIMLCTEKDMVKLIKFRSALQRLSDSGINLYAVAVKISLDNEQVLLKKVNSYIDKVRSAL